MMSGPIILCCCHGCCFPALSPHNGPTMLRCQSFIWIYTTDYRAGGKHFSTYLLLVVTLNIAQVVRGLECILYLRGWQASIICGSTRTLQHWLHIGSHTGLMSSSGIISYLKSESLFHLFLSLLHPNYPRGFSFIIEIWESGGYEEPNLCSSYRRNLDFSDICEAWSEFNFTLSFGWHQFS